MEIVEKNIFSGKINKIVAGKIYGGGWLLVVAGQLLVSWWVRVRVRVRGALRCAVVRCGAHSSSVRKTARMGS